MGKDYPFIFLNHGEIDPEYLGKCAECYIWFERDPTPAERKAIVKACPPSLSGLFFWGGRFAYFGSGGDTYDFDTINAYAGKKYVAALNKLMMEEEFGSEEEAEEPESYIEDRSAKFKPIPSKEVDTSNFDSAMSDLLGICSKRLSQDLDDWVAMVHGKVPIAFLKGPYAGDADDEWNAWSFSRLEGAIDAVATFQVATADSHESQDKECRRYLGYIISDLVEKYSAAEGDEATSPEARAKRLKLASLIYSMDGIAGAFGRLSSDEHEIHSRAGNVTAALKGLEPEERAVALATLEPFARLAYFASYNALKEEDVLAVFDPPSALTGLVASIPAAKANTVTSLISMIAHNLVHVTPAYDKPDKKRAKEASTAFDLLCRRSDATVGDYVTGAVCCEWAGNPGLGVELSEIGLKRYPKSKELLHNAISVNLLCGNQDRATELLAVEESVLDRPDENFILNKSANLLNTGKYPEASKALYDYLEAGGNRSPGVLGNLFVAWSHSPHADKDAMAKYATEAADLMKSGQEHQTRAFLENFLGFTSSSGFWNETVDCIDWLMDAKREIPPNCWVNYTYAAYYLDATRQRNVISRIEASLPAEEENMGSIPLSFSNLASIWVKLGDEDKALHYLALCKKYRHPKLATFPKDEDFKPLWGNKRFKELCK